MTTTDGDVAVHRFPVEGAKPQALACPASRRVSSRARTVSLADQLAWLDGLFRVPALFHHLVVNADRYDAVILSPYLFWTTVTGATVVPERTIVMPCLHDEPYAALDVLKPVLADVARLWFLSEPEHQLAHGIATLPPHDVTGAGVHIPDELRPRRVSCRATVSNARSSCSRAAASGGKGWDWLLAAFHFAIRQYGLPFDLVTIGVSPAGHARRRCRAGSTISASSTTPRFPTRSPRRPRTCSRAPTRASRARSWSRGSRARPCS